MASGDGTNSFANECAIAMKWIISKEKIISAENGCLKSDKMNVSTIPGLQYYLGIHPNGNKEEYRGRVRSFLHFNSDYDMSKRIVASYNISIKSTQYKYTVKEYPFDKLTLGAGGTLCTREQLVDPANNCFVDDILTIELEGNIKVRGIKRKYPDSSSNVAEKLYKKDNKDLTLRSNGEEVKVHRLILSTLSSAFETKIEALKRKTYLELDEYTPEVIKVAVDYCYEKNISKRITSENVLDILRFDNEYKIDGLKKLIEPSLIDIISKENVVNLANTSVLHGFKELRQHCVCFLKKVVTQSIDIENFETLDDQVHIELSRRSFIPIAKSI